MLVQSYKTHNTKRPDRTPPPQTRVLEHSPRRLGHICLHLQADNRTSHDMGRPAAGASPTLAARVQCSTERDGGDHRAGSKVHNRAST
jgi:hypothetical protein